jgi:hypothetical protein
MRRGPRNNEGKPGNPGNPGKPGTLPTFLSDVKARHDNMVESVERMKTADGLRRD